jgi:hypothetical protein
VLAVLHRWHTLDVPLASTTVAQRGRTRTSNDGSKLRRLSASGPTRTTSAVQQVVDYLGYSGRGADVVVTAALDPNVWSGRASQEVFIDLSALRSCINVSGL